MAREDSTLGRAAVLIPTLQGEANRLELYRICRMVAPYPESGAGPTGPGEVVRSAAAAANVGNLAHQLLPPRGLRGIAPRRNRARALRHHSVGVDDHRRPSDQWLIGLFRSASGGMFPTGDDFEAAAPARRYPKKYLCDALLRHGALRASRMRSWIGTMPTVAHLAVGLAGRMHGDVNFV